MKISIRRLIFKVICTLIVILLLATTALAVMYKPAPTLEVDKAENRSPNIIFTPAPLVDTPLAFANCVYVETFNRTDALEQQAIVTCNIYKLSLECDSGIYTNSAIKAMRSEITRLQKVAEQVNEDVKKFEKWETEYPYATGVWYYLRANGLSEEVCAGIIGNMMIETSGGTLALKPFIYDGSGGFYGLCQWSTYYHSAVANDNFEEQLEYLMQTMPTEFKHFGFCYRSGFTYEDFLKLESPEDAAMAFAKVYERCGSAYYDIRKTAARSAYNYFVGDDQ